MVINIKSNSTQTLYDQDFYLWIQETANLLKKSQFEQVDLENLIEEIETMGRSEKRELESRLTVIIEHLLKLIYWTSAKDDNERGWKITIIEQRRQLQRLLKDSPSLKVLLGQIFVESYETTREDIILKYQLPSEMFPTQPPFTVEEIINNDYWGE